MCRSTGAATWRCFTHSPTMVGTRTPITSACSPNGTALSSTGCFRRLLDDLEERGLLETTLVVCMGEFGRTPRINEIGSRDHWHQCYFSLWAGGGVQPGRTIGESDARGEHPVSEPITPAMVGTTMLELSRHQLGHPRRASACSREDESSMSCSEPSIGLRWYDQIS